MLTNLELEKYVSNKIGKNIRFEESIPYDKSEVVDFLNSLKIESVDQEKLAYNEYLSHVTTDTGTGETIILITSDYSDSDEDCYIPVIVVILDSDGNLIDSL